MARSICLGLMSGTSMDGIDAALIETDGGEYVRSIASSFYGYPDAFKRCLKKIEMIVRKNKGDLHQAAADCTYEPFDSDLSSFFAQHQYTEITFDAIIGLSTYLHYKIADQLITEHNIDPTSIAFIGYHGQTVYHAPHAQKTIQIGDPQHLANLLQIPVASGFRDQDVASGGHGAPLTPIYHWARAKQDSLIPLAILNCGGIANVSLILSDSVNELIAFDTGPGNVLLDRFVRIKTQEHYFFDVDGRYALAGHVCPSAFQALMTESLPNNFLEKSPPKSLDSYDCHVPEAVKQLSIEDGCATLAAFSSECMVRCLDFCTVPPSRFVLAGGGWHNPAILNAFKDRLEQRLHKTPQILMASQLGWQQDMLEAEAFAYLAKRVACQLPLSFPGTTGVKEPLTGGTIFQPFV